MKISKEEYAELIRISEQRQVLIRDMKSRAEQKTDYMGFNALKSIFDLHDDAREANSKDCDPWGDVDV